MCSALAARFGAWPFVQRCVTLIHVKDAPGKIDIIRDYMRDVDRTLLRENLKLTFEERARKHLRALQMVEELRRAGKKRRRENDGR
jgi:hypothetical protein